MSSIGELTFFLGLQVKQTKDGTFISQDKYVAKILKKFRLTEVKTASTHMKTQKSLLKDEDGKEVDVYMYRSMIGSLMYLTSSRPDIMFIVCAYARYQVNLKVSHLYVVKRIFRYLKGQLKLGLQYPKDSPFDLVSYIDLDYTGASLDMKSTTGDGKEIVITESFVRRDLQLADKEGIDCLPNITIFEQLALMGKPKRKDTYVPYPSGPTKSVADKAVYKELRDSLVRAATIASSLEAEQDSETIWDTTAQNSFESVSKHFNDLLLARGNTLRSDEDRLKLNELIELCTNLQNRVLDLKKTKTSQHNEMDSLKKRVKKLEKRNRSRTHKLKRLYKVSLTARVESSGDEESLGEDASKQWRIDDIDANDEITLVNDADNEMFDVDDLGGEDVFVAEQEVLSTVAITETITTEEITLAQALEALKTSKLKAKRIVFHEPCKSTTPTISSQQSQDNGKEIMIEEPVKPKKKDQIRLDEEAALKLQVEFDEEERLVSKRTEKEQEANIALIETWDDIQGKIDDDHQLAERLQAQAQEQEELSDAEKATLFQQLLKKRRKHFAAKKTEEKRNKPPTQAQKRKIMSGVSASGELQRKYTK
nr:hypothetical protein [Tanacetum cinerariifolium]